MDPHPPPLTRTQAELLRKLRAVSQAKAQEHFTAARRMARFHSLLTVPTVILSALAGSASINTVGSISSDCAGSPQWYHWLSALCSVLVAVLSALSTFWDFRSQQGRHSEAMGGYHKVLRRADMMLRSPNPPEDFEATYSALQGELILMHDSTVSLNSTSFIMV